jgi:hypothetical protein
MSKRHALEYAIEEAQNSDFRWPKRGDSPFAQAAEPLDNALIAENERTRLVLMTDGYKQAGDLMTRQALKESAARDFLVFPILFAYRHFLELSLKYMLATFGGRVSIEPNWNDHDLVVLAKSFFEMLDRYGTPDPDDADSVIASIIAEFAKIDPRSYSNRYPVDRNGNPLPVTQAALDLANLADVMEGVSGYFTGCDGYLDSLCGASDY